MEGSGWHPCAPSTFTFTVSQLSVLVRAAVEDNTLTIEPVASQALPTVKVAAVEPGSTKYVGILGPCLQGPGGGAWAGTQTLCHLGRGWGNHQLYVEVMERGAGPSSCTPAPSL